MLAWIRSKLPCSLFTIIHEGKRIGKVAIPETLPLQLRKNDPIFEHGLARLTELMGGRAVLIEVRTVFQVSSECTRAVACLDPYDTGHVYFCILPTGAQEATGGHWGPTQSSLLPSD